MVTTTIAKEGKMYEIHDMLRVFVLWSQEFDSESGKKKFDVCILLFRLPIKDVDILVPIFIFPSITEVDDENQSEDT